MLPFLYAAPLFEEEPGPGPFTFGKNHFDPLPLEGSRTRAALTANDNPVQPAQVQVAEIFQKRFDAQEAGVSRGVLEFGNSRHAMFLVFHAHAPPDVGSSGGVTQGTP